MRKKNREFLSTKACNFLPKGAQGSVVPRRKPLPAARKDPQEKAFFRGGTPTTIGHYIERPNPELRHTLGDVHDLGMKKHHMTALLELDVTKAREVTRAYRRKTGEGLSFTAWFIKCVAQAVSECPEVCAMKKGNKTLILFDDVDIAVPIEKQLRGARVPMNLIVRKANEDRF